jgi:PAS domain S-box-containing protein
MTAATFRSLIENAFDGVVIANAEGSMLYLNPAMYRRLGRTPSYWLGRSALEMVYPDDLTQGAAAMLNIQTDPARVERLDLRLVGPDGPPVWVEIIAQNRLAFEGLPGLVVNFREITERKALEQTSAQLQQTITELEGFTYAVAHDLRSPLRSISGFATALLEDYAPQVNDTGRRYVDYIVNGCEQMGRLITDLLEFSSIGRRALNIQPVNMEALARSCWRELRANQPDLNIEMSIGALPAVHGDLILLRQVWSNLIANAVKFTVGRRPAIITVNGARVGAEEVYIVRDNGVGFDQQYAGEALKVFARLHGETFPGTGVGLAIVERIVKLHGGRVELESEPDAGTLARFTLPAERETFPGAGVGLAIVERIVKLHGGRVELESEPDAGTLPAERET